MGRICDSIIQLELEIFSTWVDMFVRVVLAHSVKPLVCGWYGIEHQILEHIDKAACVCTSLSQDEATIRSAWYDSGLQHTEACNGGARASAR